MQVHGFHGIRCFQAFFGFHIGGKGRFSFQIVSSNYFQATGQPAKSVFLTLTRQILFLVPLLYLMPVVLPQLFPQFTGLDALYFAAPVADFLSIFTTAVFVAWEMARLRRLSAMYA